MYVILSLWYCVVGGQKLTCCGFSEVVGIGPAFFCVGVECMAWFSCLDQNLLFLFLLCRGHCRWLGFITGINKWVSFCVGIGWRGVWVRGRNWLCLCVGTSESTHLLSQEVYNSTLNPRPNRPNASKNRSISSCTKLKWHMHQVHNTIPNTSTENVNWRAEISATTVCCSLVTEPSPRAKQDVARVCTRQLQNLGRFYLPQHRYSLPLCRS